MRRVSTEMAILAIEDERKRLARDIHDGPAQLLTNLTMRLEVVKEMAKRDPLTVLPEIQKVQELMRGSVSDLRRMIYDLRPVDIAERGLSGALLDYAERCHYLLRIPVVVAVDATCDVLAEPYAVAVFRVVQECITNSLRHARAQRVDVSVTVAEGVLRAVVRDDGSGFPYGDTSQHKGFGLLGIEERARLIGGVVRVQSQLGQGTVVELTLGIATNSAE